jgi:hypothetical protein
MTRTAYVFPVVALFLFGASFAYASDNRDRYDHDDYDNDYYSYDTSIRHSYNNYDSFNYTYGYPATNYSYAYPSYNYGSYATYGYDNYGYNSDYRRKPTCSISTMRTSGANPYDNRVTISWWSSNATSAYLSNYGSVNTSGSQTLSGAHYSSYTLTVTGPGGSTTCSASSPYYDSGTKHHGKYSHEYGHGGYLSNPTFNYPIHSYPYVSGAVYPTLPTYQYVTLTQMPYTGFDLGVVGNSLYWLGMILIAAAGAYLIVYSHSGAMPRAFVREVSAAARNQLRLVRRIVR